MASVALGHSIAHPVPADEAGEWVVSPPRHMPGLDGLRGCAILLVMVYHLADEWHNASGAARWFIHAAEIGWAGVDLFFVLSGFLITGILLDAKDSPRYFSSFYGRRALRIFPLYYAVLTIVMILRWMPERYDLLRLQEMPASPWWLWIYATNIVQAVRQDHVFGALGHFWSLAVEEHFYMVWPAVVYFISRRALIGLCLFLIPAAALGRLAAAYFGGDDWGLAIYSLTPFRVDGLALGALLATLMRTPKAEPWLRRLWPWALALSTLLLIGLFAWRRDLSHHNRVTLTLGLTIIGFFAGALLMWAVTAPPVTFAGRCFGCGPLRSLGKVSFCMYLIHQPLIPLFAILFPPEKLSQLLGTGLPGLMVFLALALGATYALAMLSWHAFEKHFMKLKGKFSY